MEIVTAITFSQRMTQYFVVEDLKVLHTNVLKNIFDRFNQRLLVYEKMALYIVINSPVSKGYNI